MHCGGSCTEGVEDFLGRVIQFSGLGRDEDGEVIGVYSGHGAEGGHVLGFAIPAPFIVEIIQQAATPTP